MTSFRFDPEATIVGGVLRRAVGPLSRRRELRFDPHRAAALNDLVFAEITRVPPPGAEHQRTGLLERVHLDGGAAASGGVRLRMERPALGPCVGVVANRYAPPHLIGGLTNPLTGKANGEIRGGAEVDGLFGVNALGFVNHASEPAALLRVRVCGVVVDDRGDAIGLGRFREGLSVPTRPPSTRLIVVAGHATDAGKTTCAWALVSSLRARGFRVTVEKKTGTACCKDWLRCLADPRASVLEAEGDCVSFDPDELPARDFVDGLGVASDVSMETTAFAAESVRYTQAYLAAARADFHVVELADGIAHASNAALLQSEYFRRRTEALVYAGLPTHEAAAHFLAYLRSLGCARTRVLLSGPLANEGRYAPAREEIRAHLATRICRSAILEDGRWVADGDELASAVLETRSTDRKRRNEDTPLARARYSSVDTLRRTRS